MATTEKKVIEIVVKTVGDADIKRLGREMQAMRKEAQASRKSIEEMNVSMSGFGRTLKGIGGLLGVGFTLKGLVQSSEQIKQLNDEVRGIAQAFVDATFAASGFAETLNDPTFWQQAKDQAIGVANAIGSVFKKAKEGYDFLHDPLRTRRDFEKEVRDATPIAVESPAMTEQFFQAIADATAQIKINVEDTGKVMEGNAETARYWAEFDRQRAANSKAALEAESKAAARDARANTPQFAHDPSQFAAEMEEVARATHVVRLDMDEIDSSMLNMIVDSQRFQDGLVAIGEALYTFEDALGDVSAYYQEINDAQASLFEQTLAWGDALTRGVAGVLNRELHNTRDLLRTIAEEMRNFYAELAARAAAQQALGFVKGLLGLGMGSSGSAAEAIAAGVSAKGNVFSAGELVPFARGGIVSQPTIFPMARGLGLMGEAGPEAVMPLKRGADGRLGVQSSAPQIIVNNYAPGVQAQVVPRGERLEIEVRAARMGANAALAQVNRSVSSGYGSTAQSMQRAYGLRRKV